GNYPLAAPPPAAAPPPQPALPSSGQQPAASQAGPFPGRPSGRVFGSPPSRSGPSVTPRPPAEYLAGEQASEIKPVPLARAESSFEPLAPSPVASKRSMPGPAEPPPSEGPPDGD